LLLAQGERKGQKALRINTSTAAKLPAKPNFFFLLGQLSYPRMARPIGHYLHIYPLKYVDVDGS